MKHELNKITKEEKLDILERYSEWMKPENIIWVEKEFETAKNDLSNDFDVDLVAKIINRLESYSFCKSPAERIWVLEKLKDHYQHSSDYIESRIGEILMMKLTKGLF